MISHDFGTTARLAITSACTAFLLSTTSPSYAETRPRLLQEYGAKTDVEGLKTIAFNIRAMSRCIFGDLEAIALDFYHSKVESKMLLSLEPLLVDQQNYPRRVKDVSKVPGLLAGGHREEFGIPEPGKPLVLGVFLCMDSNNTGSCLQKEVRPINTVIADYRVGQKREGPPRDKIYFFKFLILAQGKVYFSPKPLNKNLYPELQQKLVELGFDEQAAAASTAAIVRFNSELGSIDFKEVNNVLQLSLPKFDKKRCG